MSDPYPLLEACLNGELEDQDFLAFNAWLREDPEHLRQWVLASFMSHELAEALAQESATIERPPVIDQAGAAGQGVMDAEVLSLLEQIEAASHDAPLRELDLTQGKTSRPSRQRSSDSIDLGAAMSDLSWAVGKLARKLLASKPAYSAYAAAAVLLCVVFFMHWGGEDAEPIAELPPVNTAPGVETPSPFMPPVATLAAERDAVWHRRPGEDLYAGQRFTLNQGFAEVVTTRGAIALIEAPATIEFLDNPNAIYLHSGKLVGICETQSSKGFVVRTPQMDMVDLGTEFGVTVRRDRVETVVFDGEVEVYPTKPPGASGSTAPVRLSRGQYAAAGPAGTLASGDMTDGSVGLSYLRSLNPDEVASRRYAQSVLEQKPLIYWGMQDLAVQAVVNRGTAGNRYDGRAQATEQREGGVGGAYARFGNAGDDSVIAVDEPIKEIQGADSYTIECWARVEKHHRGMVAVLTAGNRRNIMHLEVLDNLYGSDVGGTARTVRFMHREKPAETGGQQLYSDPYPLGVWMHLVCVKNGDSVAFYVDGELVAQQACERFFSGTLQLMIGRLDPKQGSLDRNARTFYGDLDEFALYPHALDLETIRRHYALGTEALGDQ
ncbi:MAG: LamG-like jellyroll fold domain-containing protein [Planctomycetota bacterium]